MLEYKDFIWKDDELYLHGEHMLSVVPDARFPSQWRIKWPNGDLSHDFYNYSRVKDNSIRITLSEKNKQEMERGYDLE